MLTHPEFYLEKLDQNKLAIIVNGALGLLEKTGLLVQHKTLLAAITERAESGVSVGADGRVRFSPEKTLALAAQAPSVWTHQARNSQNNASLGGAQLCVSPGYGSVFMVDTAGRRREAKFADYLRLTRLSQASPLIDICSALVVEPADVPIDKRAATLTAALLLYSDKPIMGAVTGEEGARKCFEAAEIVLGDLKRAAFILGLININSPLRLDERMAGALWQYIQKGQPVVFTPGASMGITGPAAVSGNMVQSYADLLGATAVTQLVAPGHPVIVGNGGFGGNLYTGNPGYGRPENGLASIVGAQLARHFKLPYRCSAAVTSAMTPDGRAALEHTMTAMSAWSGGANLAMQAAGIIDSINSMNYEQFIIDLEIWGYVKRLSQPVKTDKDSLALELIAQTPSSYMDKPHTLKHFRQEIYEPLFGKPQKPSAIKEVNELAAERLVKIEQETSPSLAVDPKVLAELKKYLAQGDRAFEAFLSENLVDC